RGGQSGRDSRWREERTVTQNLTLHYDLMLILEPTPHARGLARKKVEVVNYPDGRFAVQFNGTSLPFSSVRQGPDRSTQHDCGQQAAVGGAGDGEGQAGGIRAEPSARACGAAAAAEQSGGARVAIEGPGI